MCCSNCTDIEPDKNEYLEVDDTMCRDITNVDFEKLTKELEDITLFIINWRKM